MTDTAKPASTTLDDEPIYPHWTRTVEWLSHRRGKWACLSCVGCGLRKTYDVNDIIEKQGDLAVKSLPHLVARLIGCKRMTAIDAYNPCRIRFDHMHPFVDPPKPKRAEPIKLPIGTSKLEARDLKDVPEYYEVLAYCPCGWRKRIDLRWLRRSFPEVATTDELARRLQCRRCRNKVGHVLAYRFASR